MVFSEDFLGWKFSNRDIPDHKMCLLGIFDWVAFKSCRVPSIHSRINGLGRLPNVVIRNFCWGRCFGQVVYIEETPDKGRKTNNLQMNDDFDIFRLFHWGSASKKSSLLGVEK